MGKEGESNKKYIGVAFFSLDVRNFSSEYLNSIRTKIHKSTYHSLLIWVYHGKFKYIKKKPNRTSRSNRIFQIHRLRVKHLKKK